MLFLIYYKGEIGIGIIAFSLDVKTAMRTAEWLRFKIQQNWLRFKNNSTGNKGKRQKVSGAAVEKVTIR